MVLSGQKNIAIVVIMIVDFMLATDDQQRYNFSILYVFVFNASASASACYCVHLHIEKFQGES